MQRNTFLPFVLLSSCLLSACSSVSFKQGAGGADFKSDERTCMGTTTERTAFLQCMEAKGWWTRSAEELSRINLVSVEESEAGEATAGAGDATDTTSPTATATTTARSPAVGTAQPASQPSRSAPAPKDPMSRLRIAMWSKAGAGANELIADQNQCLSTLGDTHAPDTTAGTVTRGMYDCLHQRGWTGLTFR
ncbi:hypothetical protein [Methyloversatilis sp.]|uniref:hypothetical protein n=1 Tax=Methyloversatilis sp. TaxID=2569862 RepID=UPI0035B039C8